MSLVLMAVLVVGVPGYFIVQPLALVRWAGGWRKAALAPLVLTVPALVFSLVALGQGSNLWPLALAFTAAIGTLYLGALWLVRCWI
jgi:hypothetical protein